MSYNRPTKQLLRSKLSNATRPTHGPKHTWIDVVTRERRSLHISLRDADNRAAWRSAITLRCQTDNGYGGIKGVCVSVCVCTH